MSVYLLIRQILERRLGRASLQWFKESAKEIADGVKDARFCALISAASRHARREPLLDEHVPTTAALQRAVEGMSFERWSLLEGTRVALLLARSDLAEESAAIALAEAFRFADEGELCALYRSLALLPEPERFVWRAGEGCRSNMRSVFEATALGTPFPVKYFDDVAWKQAVLKCVFIGAPLWRMWGLDTRLSPDLARMALDLVDERRSAGRPVPHELWLCLGTFGKKRAIAALEAEVDASNPNELGRRAAVYALVRAGRDKAVRKMAEAEPNPKMALTMRDALSNDTSQLAFRALDPTL